MADKKTFDGLNISRRDFVNGTLVGSGAALLSAAAPGARAKPTKHMTDPWTGYGGVGDYARSNGNVASTRKAAHLIRDGFVPELMDGVEDTGEVYDMVIIGGGFSGIGAAYQYRKLKGTSGKCLIIENHPIFGGEAKQNEFDVDGYRLYGPQGSNDFGVPNQAEDDFISNMYRDVGLPFEFKFAKQDLSKTKLSAPVEHYYGVFWEEERYDTGYFLGKDSDPKWVINPRRDKLARLPWDEKLKADLNKVFVDGEDYYEGEDIDQWLDSMSYKDLLENVMKVDPRVTEYLDPIIAISMGGVGADVYSAYSAKLLEMPGTGYHYAFNPDLTDQDIGVYSYPGGNAGSIRHMVKYLIPDSITGGSSFEDILYNPIDFDALDRPENPCSIRLNATAVDVRHDGDPDTADHVLVSYHIDGQIKRVKARHVVMGIGGWVARNIAKDIPEAIADAYSNFHHSPILCVNVAVRNWRFLDKLGITAGRWFEGFGNFFAIRRPMDTGDKSMPFDPDKPTVMTFYVPFNNPGYPAQAQGAIGRNEMLAKSYREYETEIITQLTDMFGDYGFDAERDIAGIVLNRWGHAYIAPQPGFHFGIDGKPAWKEVVREGYGRIQFGHSELTGYMSHTRAINEGARAVRDVLKKA